MKPISYQCRSGAELYQGKDYKDIAHRNDCRNTRGEANGDCSDDYGGESEECPFSRESVEFLGPYGPSGEDKSDNVDDSEVDP